MRVLLFISENNSNAYIQYCNIANGVWFPDVNDLKLTSIMTY